VSDRTFLSWPFFEERHRALAEELEAWCEATIHDAEAADPDEACRSLVQELGSAGFLKLCVGDGDSRPDVRSLAICREILARYHGLADFAFAMQGLGAGPVSLFGSDALKARYLPPVAAGEAIAAFAISEAEAGSDVAAST
jgi:acyl-CoA dehydrogenase